MNRYEKRVLKYGVTTTIAIPKKICEELNIQKGDVVEIEILNVKKTGAQDDQEQETKTSD